MNERIKELAEQAGYEKDMFGIGHWDMPECQKFAELIVKECGVALSPMLRDMISRGQAYDMIKEHFGIEEEYRPSVQETHCPHDILLDKYCKKCDDEVSKQLRVK